MSATVRGIAIGGRTGSVDTAGDREYSVTYRVTTSSWEDGANTVVVAPGIPKIGDIFSPGNDADDAAVVINKRAEEGDSPDEWNVVVDYSTDIDFDFLGISAPPGEQQPENPLDEAPQKSIDFVPRRVIVPGAWSDPESVQPGLAIDTPIVMSNGEPPNPPPEVDLYEPIFTVTKNEAYVNPVDLAVLANCVNSDHWQGFYPRQLKLNPTARTAWHRVIGTYWIVTYRFHFRYDTWDVKFENRGTYYWSGGKPDDITTAIKSRFDTIEGKTYGPLAADGDKNTSGDSTFTEIEFYRAIPFSSLGIL